MVLECACKATHLESHAYPSSLSPHPLNGKAAAGAQSAAGSARKGMCWQCVQTLQASGCLVVGSIHCASLESTRRESHRSCPSRKDSEVHIDLLHFSPDRRSIYERGPHQAFHFGPWIEWTGKCSHRCTRAQPCNLHLGR